VLGVGFGLGFAAADWVQHPLFLAIALSAASLGLVVPVLKDAGLAERPVGQFTIAGATVADFGAVLLLSFLFSEAEGGAASRVFAIATFAVVIAAVAFVLTRAERSRRIDAVLVALQDTTAEIRVRDHARDGCRADLCRAVVGAVVPTARAGTGSRPGGGVCRRAS
jgi:Kef-type K+ transport system membrane component KefB